MKFATANKQHEVTQSSVTSPHPFHEVVKNNTSSPILSDDSRSKSEKLTDLKSLMDAGIITEEEFANMKRQILNS